MCSCGEDQCSFDGVDEATALLRCVYAAVGPVEMQRASVGVSGLGWNGMGQLEVGQPGEREREVGCVRALSVGQTWTAVVRDCDAGLTVRLVGRAPAVLHALVDAGEVEDAHDDVLGLACTGDGRVACAAGAAARLTGLCRQDGAGWQRIALPPGAALRVQSVSAGQSHCLVLIAVSGQVLVVGRGACGQLGLGRKCTDTEGTLVPVHARGLDAEDACAGVAAGHAHSALWTSQGRVFTFGAGGYARLGLAGEEEDDELEEEADEQTAEEEKEEVAQSHEKTGAVEPNRWRPCPVRALEGLGTMTSSGRTSGVQHVACGRYHSAAVTTDGDVYTWGWGKFGQLGIGHPHVHSRSEEGFSDDLVLERPTLVPGVSHATRCGCGSRHTTILIEQGVLLCGTVHDATGRWGQTCWTPTLISFPKSQRPSRVASCLWHSVWV